MHTLQSSYTRWTWIVAILLALILLWMLFTGRGPSSACCGVVSEPAAVATPADSSVVTEAPSMDPNLFSFDATADEFKGIGHTDGVTWLNKVDDLKQWLAGGKDWSVKGNANSVTLTGTVDSEETKQAKGAEAQALFGSDVSIDNQLSVQAPEPVAVVSPPEAAKLYFDTGKTSLPNDSNVTLEPIVTWLNANPQAKAVISGYHDARGSKAKNEKLAKNRAQSTLDALVAAGIATERIEMRKPMETEGDGNLDEARRVEVMVE